MSVFLGWLPDVATQAALAALQGGIRVALPADAPPHEWRTPAQWHMTLRYFGGSVDDAQRTRIDAALHGIASGTAPADASLAGAEYWPHACALIAKVDPSDALTALLEQLESTMQGCGFARERAQIAHLTLAYLPRGACPPALPTLAPGPAPLRIDRLHLLRTVPGGYMPLASWPLSRAAGEA